MEKKMVLIEGREEPGSGDLRKPEVRRARKGNVPFEQHF
jgi:hypothetical protein